MKKIIYTFCLTIFISVGILTVAGNILFAAENLVPNYSVEDSNATSTPTDWKKGGYGINQRTLTYPVSGYNSDKAVRVDITTHESGDAKWYFSDIPVSQGEVYTFSDYYISDITSYVDVRYTLADGSYKYGWVATVGPNPDSTFKKISAQFTVPESAVSVTIFHVINQVGYLTTDEFSITKVEEGNPGPIDETNLVSNPDMELAGSSGMPLEWKKGGYGANTRVLSYPMTGIDNSKAVITKITDYTSGDAKWHFTPISVTAGNYTYSDSYRSNIQSVLTVQFQNNDNSYSYKDIAVLPEASEFTNTSVSFTVPTGVKNITVFHLIEGIGTLTIDNVALRAEETTSSGIFETGAVTFRFDDGWLSAYNNALPKLNEAGFKGVFYIVSQRFLEDGYSGFINHEQLLEIYDQGHEIGAHTRTHPHLTDLSAVEQENEIRGSREDLLALGIPEVNSFSYPFGNYTNSIVQMVKDAGYSSAVSVLNGYVNETADRFLLKRKSVVVTTTVAEIKAMIDEAMRSKTWVILELHEINNSGNTYSMTKGNFDQIVDYAVAKGIRVVTVSEGVEYMK